MQDKDGGLFEAFDMKIGRVAAKSRAERVWWNYRLQLQRVRMIERTKLGGSSW